MPGRHIGVGVIRVRPTARISVRRTAKVVVGLGVVLIHSDLEVPLRHSHLSFNLVQNLREGKGEA